MQLHSRVTKALGKGSSGLTLIASFFVVVALHKGGVVKSGMRNY